MGEWGELIKKLSALMDAYPTAHVGIVKGCWYYYYNREEDDWIVKSFVVGISHNEWSELRLVGQHLSRFISLVFFPF